MKRPKRWIILALLLLCAIFFPTGKFGHAAGAQRLHNISMKLGDPRHGSVQPDVMAQQPLSLPVPGPDVLYTTDEDFAKGFLLNLDHESVPNNQLQVNPVARTAPLPYIAVAVSERGTLVRADVNSGQIVGEYRTAPEGRSLDPSRVAVDLYGNVWAANRGEEGQIDGIPHGSVTKIGLVVGGTRVNAEGAPDPAGDYLAPPFGYNTCIDRNGDGLIQTSRGLGDIHPWQDSRDGTGGATGLVEDADDECILIYQRLRDAEQIRHVSINADNNLWVGGYPRRLRTFYEVDGENGAIVQSFDARAVGCGGYGGLVDSQGMLWSASQSQWRLLRYDPVKKSGQCIEVPQSYGLAIDSKGFVWNSMWVREEIQKIDATTMQVSTFTHKSFSDPTGVAVTLEDDHVWVINNYSASVNRLNHAGEERAVIPVGERPTGIAIDTNGKVWVANRDSDSLMRIDPTGGVDGLGGVDLTVALGDNARPESYGDMTGMVALGITSHQGMWRVMQDAGQLDARWGTITWNREAAGSEPEGTGIVVEARAADAEAALSRQPFQAIANGEPFSMSGRFIEVRATLKAGLSNASPILSDLRIQTAPQDATAPRCEFFVDPDPPTTIDVTVQDAESGLATVNVLKQVNLNVTVPDFVPGTTEPQVAHAVAVDLVAPSTLELEVTDVAGNRTTCDPLIVQVKLDDRSTMSYQHPNLPSSWDTITIYNDQPGIDMVLVRVNGVTRQLLNLEDTGQYNIDISAAVSERDVYALYLRFFGTPGDRATIMTWEGDE